MLLLLLLIPLIGIFAISSLSYNTSFPANSDAFAEERSNGVKLTKVIALITSVFNLFLSLVVFIFFSYSNNMYQFVQEYYSISTFDLYLGVDGISIYFVILTTIIIPTSILSNWNSISENVKTYMIIMLLLETLLLAVFLVLDILLFYIFFESILPPLFLLIGIFGSDNRVRAGFYLFLYTLFGSLFLLLSILTISSTVGTTDFDVVFKVNFNLTTQIVIFIGFFIAFAIKTPVIFLNNWLLKAHVESPLGGSIVLAAIVLKLSLYGIIRLMLPMMPKANLTLTPIIYTICVITIILASYSTLRTIDIKELIAYSSVSHAAVYVMGAFSNTIQGIEGAISLGLAHGYVSSGLFICVGGILYDRTHTRLKIFYRGMAQIMPIFSIFFLILALSNAGTPLSFNFIGEFMSLYGSYEKHVVAGSIACSSIVLSAAYSMYMYNSIAFGGSTSKFFTVSLKDLSKREFFILLTLVIYTVFLGLYPSIVLDGLHYYTSLLLY